jgi:hypothetical protein
VSYDEFCKTDPKLEISASMPYVPQLAVTECILLFSEFYVFCGRCYKEIGIVRSYSFRNSERNQFDLSLTSFPHRSTTTRHKQVWPVPANLGDCMVGGRIDGVESGEVSGGKGRNGQAKGKYNQPKPPLLQLIKHPHSLKPGVPTHR